MLAIILALFSATGYGAADFLAGMAARRASVIQITLAVYAVGAATIAAVLPWSRAGHLSVAALAWGALSGAGLATEALFLAEGFRRAEFSIAGPLSAVTGAGLAVIAGLAWGEHPGSFALIGLALVLPAVLAVSGSAAPRPADAAPEQALPPPPVLHPEGLPAGGGRRRQIARGGLGGAAFGVIAGVGGAVFLIGAAKAGPAAGMWPVLAIQVAAMVTTALVAAVTGNLRIPGPGARWLSVSSGCIGAGAALLYVGAADAGMLAIAAAVTGLFPVVTVGLARVVEKERLGVIRFAGLAMATVAVALIGIGQ